MAKSTSSISLVDDDESVRKALGRLLRSIGLSVQTFATAEEFLMNGLQPPPDCLILDVRMPGMSGIELRRHLAAAGQRIPIVFITGHEDEQGRREAIQAGAAGFLYKPFDEQGLLAAVAMAIRKSREGNP